MAFLTKNKTLKFIRYFVMLSILIFLVLIFHSMRNLKYFEEDHQAEEKSNLQNSSILNLEKTLPTTPYEVTFSEKKQKKMDFGKIKSHIIQVKSKVNSETSKRTSLFYSKHQESCLKKYLLDVEALLADPKRTLELVTRNVSQAYMFESFYRITKVLNVKSCIIEPSILLCLLPVKYSALLTKRNFPFSNFTGSQRVLTLGILGEDVPILQKKESIHEFRNIGLQPYFVEVPLAPWMKEDSSKLFKNDKYTSHIFYMYYTWTFHIVVFYKRNNYMWHSALKRDEHLSFLPENNLLYVNHDSAYENFSFNPVLSKSHRLSNIFTPSVPHYFLFQIPSSRFLECNPSRSIYIPPPNVTPNSNSSSEFNKKALTALRELKIFFQDVLMNFWIFSGTLLGWYRQCGVIPYTSDVDFGAWKSEIDDLEHIIRYFRKNKKLFILERMGLLEEALEFQLRCDGLRVDIFFMYKIDNGTWASGHRPSKGYYFRYHYPFFTLCSAELLQEKVQVPCETQDLILIEYGKKWMHPVKSWNYESSIHNRGPNIYWDEKRRPKAYQTYI